MAVGYSTTVRNARMTAILTALDLGAAGGKLLFYTATRPATGVAISTQTLLGTLTLSDPAGTVATGALTLSAVTPDTDADASGDISWARLTDSDDVFVADLSVTATGGGGDITVDNITVVAASTISVTSGVLTEGNP